MGKHSMYSLVSHFTKHGFEIHPCQFILLYYEIVIFNVNISQFAYPFPNWHLGCSPCLTVTNNDAMIVLRKVFLHIEQFLIRCLVCYESHEIGPPFVILCFLIPAFSL